MVALSEAIRDQFRTLLRVRKVRRQPLRGGKPRIGASVVRGEVRMKLQAGVSDDLWMWLMDLGWREVDYRPDRRRYRDVPSADVTRLIDAAPSERMEALSTAVDNSSWKPSVVRAGLSTQSYRR